MSRARISISQSTIAFGAANEEYQFRNVKDSALITYERIQEDYYISFYDALRDMLPEDKVDIIKRKLKEKELDDMNRLHKISKGSLNMTSDDVAAIFAYTFDFGDTMKEYNIYSKVNTVLAQRNANSLRSIRGYLLHLFTAISHIGQSLIVKNRTLYRGIDGKKTFNFSEHKTGYYRSWPGFTSTSVDDDLVIENFLEKAETPILFEIVGAVGYKINIFSEHSDEDGNTYNFI